ncbi:MAG: hypothetical protein R3B70_08595 [Polyangiaceae bacterium]
MGTISRRKEATLDDKLDELEAQWPLWSWLRTRLKGAGLTPSSAWAVRPQESRSSWLLMAQPSEALIRHFELAPEVLVLVSPWDEIQAHNFQSVAEVFRRQIRVDPGFALVITHDAGAERRLASVLPADRRFVFVTDEELQRAPDPQAFLRARLREGLGARRLFDHRRPATGAQFFGRERELESLERDVNSGHSLGLFGLRKVGKTSLLRRLAEKFRNVSQQRVFPVLVDLLALPYEQRNFAGVLTLICSRMEETLYPAGVDTASLPSDPQKRIGTFLRWSAEYETRILLVLDEYEVLVGGRVSISDGLAVLDWLRGLVQMQGDVLSLILAGRNSRLLSPARVQGVDNPMYRFLRTFRVAGLDPEECRSMVRKLGTRMGLDFKFDALERMVELTGGHPALVHTLGDLIDRQVPITARNPATIDSSSVEEVLPCFAHEVDEDMRELVEASNDLDPRAAELLRHRAFGVEWIGGQAEAQIVDALVGYGILRGDTGDIRMAQFSTWLRENYQPPARSAHG